MRTLVLDNTYFPVRIVTWQKAMILLFTGRAEVLTEYSEKKIRSTTQTFNLPKTLRLFNRHRTSHKVKFSRQNVFWRDNFQCQYCFIKLPASKLTIDHVVPQSREGGTDWENVVACCPDCNVRKGSQLPNEANMPLKNPPRVPKWSPQICLRVKKEDPDDWNDWFPNKKVS
ncbi:MAG: HNH endonuclease [Oligoflexia bacterium]|nr:HNH endonuclease [Oligoflexia bacterium]